MLTMPACASSLYSLLVTLIEQVCSHSSNWILKQSPDEAFGIKTANYFVSCCPSAATVILELLFPCAKSFFPPCLSCAAVFHMSEEETWF